MYPPSGQFRSSAIEELCRRDGISPSEFARRVGVSRQLVSRWMLGHCEPQFRTVLRLCEVFKVSPLYFAQGVAAGREAFP